MIQKELYRNLGLACLCVFIVTVILIAHVGTSLMVFLCVLFTLVSTAGVITTLVSTAGVSTTLVSTADVIISLVSTVGVSQPLWVLLVS